VKFDIFCLKLGWAIVIRNKQGFTNSKNAMLVRQKLVQEGQRCLAEQNVPVVAVMQLHSSFKLMS
jgi:hypothetical protein